MMMKTNPAASACKASAKPRFGAIGRVARGRAAVVVPRAATQYYYSTAVANGTPPAPLSLSATSNAVDDNFSKLNAAYYKTFVSATTNEGEAIQLFTPYRTILADSDADLLTHMDGKPQFNLVVTNDNIPSLLTASAKKLKETPEPGAGYYSVYKAMLGDFKTATGASLWIDLMQKDGQWQGWTAFRKLPENKGKLVSSKMLKSFVFGPDYDGVLGEQVYQAYVQNSLQLPGSAISNMADFRDSEPPPSATDYYQTRVKDVLKAIQSAQSLNVNFSFKQQTTDLSKTWAEGRLGGAYNMFSASASTSYDKLSEKITRSEISIGISMDHLGTVVVDGKQGPWYQLSALTTARNKDSGIFQNDQQFYNHFNTNGTPKGDMVYSTSELVVAMGVNVEMQIKLDLDEHEFEEFKVAAKAGFWPFFSASGSGGHSTDVEKVDSSTLRIVQGSTDAKQMFILGRKVNNVYDL